MGLARKLAAQCRKPSGFAGKWLGRLMNLEHTSLRNWGIAYIDIAPKSNVLDIGCGGGKAIEVLASQMSDGHVYGVDYSQEMVRLSRSINRHHIKHRRVDILNASVDSLPFTNDFFDVITAFETTFFWPDLGSSLKEVNRVLKTSGVLLIVNEKYKNDSLREKDLDWVKLAGIDLYTEKEYVKMIQKAGFASVKVNVVQEKNWISVVAIK